MVRMSGLKSYAKQLLKRGKKSRVVLLTLPFLAAGCSTVLPAMTAQTAQVAPSNGNQQGVVDRSPDGVLTQQWVCDAGSGLGTFVQFTHYSPKRFVVVGKTSMRETFRITPQGFTDFYYTDQPHIVIQARGNANGETQTISYRGPYDTWSARRGGQLPANVAEQFSLIDGRAKAAIAIVGQECNGSFPETFHTAIAIPRQDGMQTEYAAVQVGNTRIDVYRDSFRGVVDGVKVQGSGDFYKKVLIGRANSNFISFRINGVDVPAYTRGGAVVSSPGFSGVFYEKPNPTPEQQQIIDKVKVALKAAEPIMSFERLQDNGYFPSDRDGNTPSIIKLFKPQP